MSMQENSFSDKSIILIGMPASGKSTVGVILAKVLGFDFTDTDILIQNREGCRLETIIKSKGIEQFLAVESDVCINLKTSRAVIATGGSVVYSDRAMQHLKSLGTVIYLHVDQDNLKKRLRDVAQRGVVLREGQSVDDLYLERTPLYERYADFTVHEGSMSLEDTVTAVCALIR